MQGDEGYMQSVLASNLAFSEWPRVFGGDEKLTTALLDRLAEHAIVITTKGKSYRMRKRYAEEPAMAVTNAEVPPTASEAEAATEAKTRKSRLR
jgi:hypothetical protein